ncbi:hypothetical protein ACFV94_13875 [Streptomyces sp. NPDC059896]|uniref:hypothetical protein n=1 Tax=Streptomyces sp. NPDC059896 TaxID=3346993 RepID=UPI0036644E6B
MPRTRTGSRRRRFVGVGVGGALLGVLVALLFCLPSTAVAVETVGAPEAVGAAEAVGAPGTAGAAVAVEGIGTVEPAGTVGAQAGAVGGGQGGQTPGCGRGDRDDTGIPPLTPSRGSSVHELLPALHDARDAAGAWGVAQAVLAVTPDRGPPPVATPSPVDLSVLRV